MYEGTFHEAVGTLLAVAQLFGIMPVRGIKAKNPSKLKFTKCSFRFFFCLLYVVGTLWISVLDFRWIATTKVEFGKLITLIYDTTNFLSLVCFLDLAQKWPRLMQQWYRIEKSLPQMRYQLDKQKMAYDIKMVSLVVFFASMCKLYNLIVCLNFYDCDFESFNDPKKIALQTLKPISGEHLLSIIAGAHGANNCPSIRDPIKAFLISSYPQVFLVFPYSGFVGAFTKFINIISLFAWSFTDLFVIIVSIGLAEKFHQINLNLMCVKGKRGITPQFWLEYRVYYREIVNLINMVDIAIAKIILISISNNLFFICVQLLRSLE